MKGFSPTITQRYSIHNVQLPFSLPLGHSKRKRSICSLTWVRIQARSATVHFQAPFYLWFEKNAN